MFYLLIKSIIYLITLVTLQFRIIGTNYSKQIKTDKIHPLLSVAKLHYIYTNLSIITLNDIKHFPVLFLLKYVFMRIILYFYSNYTLNT